MTTRNPLERSAAWTVLLEQGKFTGLTGNADSDMTTKFLDDFHASGATRMWEFAETWSPDSAEPDHEEQEELVRDNFGPTSPEYLDLLADRAEEPEPGDYDPGPEVDDQGGVSEVDPRWDEVERAEAEYFGEMEA